MLAVMIVLAVGLGTEAESGKAVGPPASNRTITAEPVEQLGPPERGSSDSCRDVQVRVRAADTRQGWLLRGYSAETVKDLEFEVTTPRKLAGRDLELWVYTPNGHLYQALDVPTGTPIKQRLGRRAVPWERAGIGRVSYLSAWWMRVPLRFPVSGTLITTNGLYGRWRVEPHLERDPQACGAGASFGLKP